MGYVFLVSALYSFSNYLKWPPPPRTTPIIVPIHLRDTGSTPVDTTIDPPAGKTKPTKTKNKKAKSSLHRAVMERLEVQKAMSDLT